MSEEPNKAEKMARIVKALFDVVATMAGVQLLEGEGVEIGEEGGDRKDCLTVKVIRPEDGGMDTYVLDVFYTGRV